MERDNALSHRTNHQKNFNSHAHVERDIIIMPLEIGILNFNSHAHVERDDPNNYTDKIDLNISTHTLTWSVTDENFLAITLFTHFNSHAHVERDERRD